MRRHLPGTHAVYVPRQLVNWCTKYGAIDLFTQECWHGAVPCHLNESSNVFDSFGRVISQNFFRKFTFEIIDYFKCCSNGSSRPQLNQMLEFSLNRPTTTTYPIFFPDRFRKQTDFFLGLRLVVLESNLSRYIHQPWWSIVLMLQNISEGHCQIYLPELMPHFLPL